MVEQKIKIIKIRKKFLLHYLILPAQESTDSKYFKKPIAYLFTTYIMSYYIYVFIKILLLSKYYTLIFS